MSANNSANNERMMMLSSCVQSNNLEQDNESLRTKLRQLREENARLIASNHSLIGDLESVRYELHRTSCQVQNAEQAAAISHSTVSELKLTAERERATNERIIKGLQLKYDESTNALQHCERLLLETKAEHDEDRQSRKRIESERDMALDSAEQIQKAYETFQLNVQDRMLANQQKMESMAREKELLDAKINACSAELNDLRETVIRLTRECAVERDRCEQLEKLNTELRAQSSQVSINLEVNQKNQESLRRENVEMQATIEHQRLRLERYQEEVGESRAQLGQLEDLAHRLQQSMALGRGHMQQRPFRAEACQTSFVSSRDTSVSRVESFSREPIVGVVSELKTRPLQRDAELLSVKTELDRKSKELDRVRNELELIKTTQEFDTARSSSSNSGENERNRRRIFELEMSLNHLEDEREQLMITIASHERRLGDVEASKAACDAELILRGTQLEVLRKEATEQVAREASMNRELRKRSLQIASLEHQLDEKVGEVSTLVTRIAGLEDDLNQTLADLRQAREECDDKSRSTAESSAACAEMRRLHDMQCGELEATASALADKRLELEAALEDSNSQVAFLRQSLQEITIQSDSWKQELTRREQDAERHVASLEAKLKQSDELLRQSNQHADHIEKQLCSCQIELDESVSKLASCELQVLRLNKQLQDNAMVDVQLRALTKTVEEKDHLIRELKHSLEKEKEQSNDCEAKQSEQECELVKLLAQIAHLEQSLQQTTTDLSSDLDAAHKKLEGTCLELKRKDEEIEKLAEGLRSVQLERVRTMEALNEQLKSSRKDLKRERRQREELLSEMKQLKADMELSSAACEEKEARVRSLTDELVTVKSEVQACTEQRSRLLSDLELLKKSSSESLNRLISEKNQDIEHLHQELESVQTSLRRCEESLSCSEQEVDSLTTALQERQWELQQRAAQLTQLDMAMKERSSDWDQRLSRLETALKHSRFEAEQRAQQVKQFEERMEYLMNTLKDKSSQLIESEQQGRKQTAEIQILTRKLSEVENLLANACHDNEMANAVNREAQDQLTASRLRLETLQSELSETKTKLASTCSEHDRLARDLAEAVALLQSKETEYAKLVRQLAEAGDERLQSQKTIEHENRTLAEQHTAEIKELRRRAAMAHDEAAELQSQLLEAGERQTSLVSELRRMAQQLSSTQMELDANRAIASAQRETVMVRDAEIVRLKAQVSLLQTTLEHPLVPSENNNRRGLATSIVDQSDLSHADSANATSFLTMLPRSHLSEGIHHVRGEKTVADKDIDVNRTSEDFVREASHEVEKPDTNPDSLESMWRQLQLGDCSIGSSDDQDPRCYSNGVSEQRRYAYNSTHSANSTSGSVFEEKTMIQNRIKALIGYREPAAKKTKSKVPDKPLLTGNSTRGGERLNISSKKGLQRHIPRSVTDSVKTGKF